MSWGGKRDRAGRPKRSERRMQIWPSVLEETRKKLKQTAFDLIISEGEVIDRWAARYRNKNLVDKRTKKV